MCVGTCECACMRAHTLYNVAKVMYSKGEANMHTDGTNLLYNMPVFANHTKLYLQILLQVLTTEKLT